MGDAVHPSNIAVVREIVDALNRADIDGLLALMDRDFEWTPLEESPAAGVCRGHAQVRRYVQDWHDTLETLHLDLKDPVESGSAVAVEVNGRGRGRTSGIQLSNHFWQVWTLADGIALRMREYRTEDEARRALAAAARADRSEVGT